MSINTVNLRLVPAAAKVEIPAVFAEAAESAGKLWQAACWWAAPPTPTGPPGPPNRKKSQRWSASDVAQRPGAVQNPPAPGNKRNVLQRKKSLKEMGQTEE